MPTRCHCTPRYRPDVPKALPGQLAAHNELADTLNRHPKNVGRVSQGNELGHGDNILEFSKIYKGTPLIHAALLTSANTQGRRERAPGNKF